VTGFGDSDKVLLLALGEEMTSWEPALRAAIRQLAGGRDIIERIDHDEKIIEIKLDVIDPSLLRGIEEAVNQVAPGYRVEQLT
jgi:hypothetical protein